jgi:protein ImuB
VLHVLLRLVTRDPSGAGREIYARRLELPSPMRDVRTLRTLALLDLESHPPGAAVDRVTIVIDPTPGRVLQHTLFTRAHPTPEQLSTLLARLGALMGQDRFGAPAEVASYRPGAFITTPFACPEPRRGATADRETTVERRARRENVSKPSADSAFDRLEPQALSPEPCLVSALRRCRQPVPARVALADGRPLRVTTDRRGMSGGMVTRCAGPWRTSGEWWTSEVRSQKSEALQTSDVKLQTFSAGAGAGAWDRDEWDVSLSDGAAYRIFQDRASDAWFVDAIVD